jgi:hypothetical protein
MQRTAILMCLGYLSLYRCVSALHSNKKAATPLIRGVAVFFIPSI